MTSKFTFLALTAALAFVSMPASKVEASLLFSTFKSMPGYQSPIVHVTGNVEVNPEERQKVAKGAQNFIDSMGKRAIGFLGNGSLSQKQKEREFRKLLKSSFDMKTIGRFSLGRYWKASSSAQQKEYLKLFEDMVVEVYAARFSEYKGQKLDVRNARPDGKNDSIVQSYILDDSGNEFSIDWRVRYKNGQYKIVDVVIEGVSMTVTQRSDFSSVIQRGGGNVDVLLAHLKAN